MSSFRYLLETLWYFRRTNLAVVLGTITAAAVLSGALIVGDSMRASLRRLALDRLGRIDAVLVASSFFTADLANTAAEDSRATAVPAISLRASVEPAGGNPADGEVPGAVSDVTVLGVPPEFWSLGQSKLLPDALGESIPRGRIVINRALADRLGIEEAGEAVMLQLPTPSYIHVENPLGRKTDRVSRARLTVAAIVPNQGLGRFSFEPMQRRPLVAFVALDRLQQRIDRDGLANVIFFADDSDASALLDESTDAGPSAQRYVRLLRPRLDDFGLRAVATPQGYISVSSNRMIIPQATESALDVALKDPALASAARDALIYLATSIDRVADEESDEPVVPTPYSIVAAVDWGESPPLGPLRDQRGEAVGPLAEDEIAISRFVAEDLGAEPGDRVVVRYFLPDHAGGPLTTEEAAFRIKAIVPTEGMADDAALTPQVPGVTDQLSMGSWDPPFPFDDERIRDRDETFWDEHGPAPKAFISLPKGRSLWASRHGRTTTVRVAPPQGVDITDEAQLAQWRDRLADALASRTEALGWHAIALRADALRASVGNTPFGVLFVAFSFFLMASAVLLIVLMFRLGVAQRADQIGLLGAIGFTAAQTRWLLLGEGLLLAGIGALLGVVGGVAYGRLMIHGLNTWWLPAIGTPFLSLDVTISSLAIAFVVSLVVAAGAIAWSLRRTGRQSLLALLKGQLSEGLGTARSRRRSWAAVVTRWLPAVLLLAAVGVAVAGSGTGQASQAGAFFGAGAMVLLAAMVLLRNTFRGRGAVSAVRRGRGNLLRLALSNASRNATRSTMTVGLIGTASFLVISVSAFRLDPRQEEPSLDSGDGGFRLVAQCEVPLAYALGDPDGRRELGFTEKESELLAETTIMSLRLRGGEDASCLNLYQAQSPRVLGVPPAMIQRDGFAFSSTAPLDPAADGNPWRLLEAGPPSADQGPSDATERPLELPVFVEKNTANYSFQIWSLGETIDLQNSHGRPVQLRIAGMLANGIFQGELLTSEANLLRAFPEVTGYQFFLVEVDAARAEQVKTALERALASYGMQVTTTGERMASFLAVQNTYLSTFQSLGGLGVILGMLGLIAVQLRSVLERRGELALLRALGWSPRRVAALVFLENAALVVLGVLVGVAASAVALWPHVGRRGAELPWENLTLIVGLVLIVGLSAGLWAARRSEKLPVMQLLRGE